LVLSFLTRFKQICNHPSHWLQDGEFDPSDSGKTQALLDIAERISEQGEKLLVFTQFRALTDPLATLLEPVFERPGLVLHGGTPVKRRGQLVEEFQDPKGPPFFVLSLKAGGTGLNLTAASHVVHFDRWWNPAVENQATDRAFRIGQHRNVLVHRFVCPGTLEEKIAAMLERKRAVAEKVLAFDGEKALTELSDQELLDLVKLDLDAALLEEENR
jgi:non-specific serine/threonine protein kinase